MRQLRLVGAFAAILTLFALCQNLLAQGSWQQPAADLAAQIATILGHGTAKLMIRDQSSISVDEIPVIRKLLEQDLRMHGISAGSTPNETVIRVTLSESDQEDVWIAETIRGDDTQVVIAQAGPRQTGTITGTVQVQLRRERFLGPYELDSLPCFPEAKPPLLAVLERQDGLIVLKRGCVLALDRSPRGLDDGKGFYHFDSAKSATRDPRGMIAPSTDGDSFIAYLAGTACTGSFTPSNDPNRPPGEGWLLDCHPSDDSWPIAVDASGIPQFKTSYNAARNYFTGVASPGMGIDLPPFYSAAVLTRASGTALLIGAIDGRVALASNGKLTTVNGTSDWGSDFALIHSSCGDGAQVIVSGSGNGNTDSLRAYEIKGSEAVSIGSPLLVEGTITSVSTAPDGESVLAVIRHPQNEYEVDRVTALCD